MADRASRVCAWCGTSDGLPAEPAESTTHGLCRRCLSERIAESGDVEEEADEASNDPELTAGRGAHGRLVSLR